MQNVGTRLLNDILAITIVTDEVCGGGGLHGSQIFFIYIHHLTQILIIKKSNNKYNFLYDEKINIIFYMKSCIFKTNVILNLDLNCRLFIQRNQYFFMFLQIYIYIFFLHPYVFYLIIKFLSFLKHKFLPFCKRLFFFLHKNISLLTDTNLT